jgi:hypothetical protein
MTTELKKQPSPVTGSLVVSDTPAAFVNIAATQTVMWYKTKDLRVITLDVTGNSGGVLTIYKTMNDSPVDGTVGDAQTHNTLTNVPGSDLILGPGWNLGLAWARTSGNVTVRVGGEFA